MFVCKICGKKFIKVGRCKLCDNCWQKRIGRKKLVTVLFIILFCAVLLCGCSKSVKKPVEPHAINIDSSLSACYIHKDYVACNIEGQTYYATTERINQITKYDCTMWKDNPC